jgi:hypothetical protein
MDVDLWGEVDGWCVGFGAVAWMVVEAWEARADGAVEGDCNPDEVERQGEREGDDKAHDDAERADSTWPDECDLRRWRRFRIRLEDWRGRTILARRLLLVFRIHFIELLLLVFRIDFFVRLLILWKYLLGLNLALALA